MGELRRVLIEFGRVDRLKCFRHLTVQGHRTRSRQFVVKHLANQLVRETVVAWSGWHRHQHADDDGFLEIIHDTCGVTSAGGRQNLGAEFTAHNGCQGEHMPGIL
jgi:hypothetical protein